MPGQSDWVYLGEGTYNMVYRSKDQRTILKVPKLQQDNQTDNPERAVRLWNAINPTLDPAKVLVTEHGKGWVCPFISGEQASDEEIAAAAIKIFNNVGRIVVDATSHRNFIRTSNGEIVCVDIGLALQLQRGDEVPHQRIRRNKSEASLWAWRELSPRFTGFFKDSVPKYPFTVMTLKALLYIEKCRPDIDNANFLENRLIVTQFAKDYELQLGFEKDKSTLISSYRNQLYMIERLFQRVHYISNLSYNEKPILAEFYAAVMTEIRTAVVRLNSYPENYEIGMQPILENFENMKSAISVQIVNHLDTVCARSKEEPITRELSGHIIYAVQHLNLTSHSIPDFKIRPTEEKKENQAKRPPPEKTILPASQSWSLPWRF